MKDIQIVLAVAESRSFTQAGECVRLSQPAISLAVKRCERILGVDIFEKHGREVVVSERGKEVLDALKRIEEIFISAQERPTLPNGINLALAKAISPSDE